MLIGRRRTDSRSNTATAVPSAINRSYASISFTTDIYIQGADTAYRHSSFGEASLTTNFGVIGGGTALGAPHLHKYAVGTTGHCVFLNITGIAEIGGVINFKIINSSLVGYHVWCGDRTGLIVIVKPLSSGQPNGVAVADNRLVAEDNLAMRMSNNSRAVSVEVAEGDDLDNGACVGVNGYTLGIVVGSAVGTVASNAVGKGRIAREVDYDMSRGVGTNIIYSVENCSCAARHHHHIVGHIAATVVGCVGVRSHLAAHRVGKLSVGVPSVVGRESQRVALAEYGASAHFHHANAPEVSLYGLAVGNGGFNVSYII